jgi:uncharacterized membrane protein YtjA (UPF0391 family)
MFSLVAAPLGFHSINWRAAGVARILFFASLLLFVASTLVGLSHAA